MIPAPPAPDGPAVSSPPGADPLRRYRILQIVSIILLVGGFLGAAAIVWAFPDVLAGDVDVRVRPNQALTILLWLVLAVAAILVGLVMNVVRAVVVREVLPPDRYRGPSVIVLLLLAIVAANVASVSVAGELAALFGGEEVSTIGSLVLLTVTQLGLLGVAGLFVMAPRALAGLRLLPERRAAVSALLGLLLAIPAWIGAQLIGYLTISVLARFGLEPEAGIADVALSNADPVVLVVALVIVAPVAEEIFFRGVAFNAWLREYGARRAVLGSAILFALIHGSIFVFPSILALGFVLGVLYRETRSLPAVIALHAGFNGITVLLGLMIRFNLIDLGPIGP